VARRNSLNEVGLSDFAYVNVTSVKNIAFMEFSYGSEASLAEAMALFGGNPATMKVDDLQPRARYNKEESLKILREDVGRFQKSLRAAQLAGGVEVKARMKALHV